jgi:ankyrin repeat protein
MMRRVFILAAAQLGAAVPFARAARAGIMPTDWYTINHAAAANNLDGVKYFLAQNVNPNTKDQDDRTPLSFAASFNNVEMARVLLDHGASPDIRDKHGDTPMHWAAGAGHTQVLQMMIQARGQLDAQNRQGVTPLMMAAGGGKVAAVKALIAAGADPRKQDFTGRDAFGWATSQPAALRALRESATH